MSFLRNEYPRPQFQRDSWLPLNGEWEFEFDDREDGLKRNLPSGKVALSGKILVPFTYQYPASGIGDTSVHEVVWYRREFTLSDEQAKKHAILNFNAADYQTEVWVNGKLALTHVGGFTPFSADIAPLCKKGNNVIVVRCIDRQDTTVPRGKQSWTGEVFTCFYVANTGIWQSVWLDFVGEDGISAYSMLPDFDNCELRGELNTFHGKATEAVISVSFQEKMVKKQTFTLDGNRTLYNVVLPVDAKDCAWTPEKPQLFYVEFTLLKDGKIVDSAKSRFGLRKFEVDEHGIITLNERPYYQKLILDQGYWVEGGLTAPSIEAIKKDIELAKAMGFNGARKHQKIEDPYFYYYAEELGYLTWCEMPSAHHFCDKEMAAVTAEWQEIVMQAKSLTTNVCYVPINESWGVKRIYTGVAEKNFAKGLYYLTKAIDPTRIVSTNDGFENVNPSDILSIHDYDLRETKDFAPKYQPEKYNSLNPQSWPLFAQGERYMGQPVLFTEFGGISLAGEEENGAWGYNEGAKDGEDLLVRLEKIFDGIATTQFQGYCYTQLTDVQQEINGLLYADRTPKIEPSRVKEILDKIK